MAQSDQFAKLRQSAEEILMHVSMSRQHEQDIDFFTLLHELDTYRVELELQNQELQDSNAELELVQQELRDEIDLHYRHYENSPVSHLTVDKNWRILEVNQTFITMVGLTKSQILQRSFTDFVFPDSQDKFYRYRQDSIKNEHTIKNCQLRLILQDQSILWVQLDSCLEQSSEQQQIFLSVSDISQIMYLKNELLLTENAFQTSTEGILITDVDLKIVKVNRAFTAITGFAAHEVIGDTPRILHSGKQEPFFYRTLLETLTREHKWQGEIWNKHKDGHDYLEWLSLTAIRNPNNEVTHYLGIFTDITERKQRELLIQKLAYFDSVTSLPNRTLFQDHLKQAIAQSQREHQHGAVFIMDIDHFKVINDSLGHLVGDEVLKTIAQRLSGCVREQDTLSRMGGDEFTLLLPNLGHEKQVAIQHAIDVAEKLINSVAIPVNINDHTLHISISIGIVIYPDDARDITDIIKLADSAMYKVKRTGRNNYQFVNDNMQNKANHRLKIQDDLYQAIEQKQFELYYQPQITMDSDSITSAEAIIGWHHPENGLVMPDFFIEAAEDIGLMLPLGTWFLEQACQQMAQWNHLANNPIKHIAVPISGHQFNQKEFFNIVERVIADTQIRPDQLELELTENILLDNPAESSEKLRALEAKGIRLAIDDFGTGYSSLQYIKDLPLKTLKIGLPFIKEIGHNNNEAVVSSIITLAKNLALIVVAEGVENEQQRQYLLEKGCDLYQGVLCGKALKNDDFIEKVFEQNKLME